MANYLSSILDHMEEVMKSIRGDTKMRGTTMGEAVGDTVKIADMPSAAGCADEATVPPTPSEVVLQILNEYYRARRHHRPMRGAHEGYAVILEELDELWDDVKNNNHNPRWKEDAKKEALQVAAMALAFILEV